jgi:hypothetical protein
MLPLPPFTHSERVYIRLSALTTSTPFGTTRLVFVSHAPPWQLTAGRALEEPVETSLVRTTVFIRA